MRLIDADAIIEHLRKDPLFMLVERYGIGITGVIEAAPTKDAVPVVRCKDCKHYAPYEKFGDCYCQCFSEDPYDYLPMDDDDYCSRGERREVGH